MTRSKAELLFSEIESSNMKMTSSGVLVGASKQWEELVKAMIAARLPIHALGRKSLQTWMKKYAKNGQNLPSVTYCRRKVGSLSQADVESTIKFCK